jgi:hypothetical protein
MFGVTAAACGGDRWLLDSGGIDSSYDVATDRGTDVAHDTGTDASDSGTDASDVLDATNDVSHVTDAADVSDAHDVVDVATDSSIDVIDAAADSAADVADATSDVSVDAGPSGRCTPVIDGVLGGDWTSDAIVATDTAASNWGAGLNDLRSIRVCYDADALYLGIDGDVESTNAIVAYIDRDYDPPGGAPTGVSLFSALADHTGLLDSRISAALSLGAGAGIFGAEAAWGTAGMQTLAATATNDSVGLRLIAPTATMDRRSNFAWATGSATTCSTSGPAACEVSIQWSALFEGTRPTSGQIALFLRINNSDGTMSSNQTLPQDDPSMPRNVNQVLVLPYGP